MDRDHMKLPIGAVTLGLLLASCATSFEDMQASRYRADLTYVGTVKPFADCMNDELDRIKWGAFGNANWPPGRRDRQDRIDFIYRQGPEFIYIVDVVQAGPQRATVAIVAAPGVVSPTPSTIVQNIRNGAVRCGAS